MAIYNFQPSAGASVGSTIKVTTGATVASVNTVLAFTNVLATDILVTNAGTVTAFVRLSPQASPVATTADVPVLAGTSRIFANPAPSGNCGAAVIPVSGTAVDVYFTPGVGSF